MKTRSSDRFADMLSESERKQTNPSFMVYAVNVKNDRIQMSFSEQIQIDFPGSGAPKVFRPAQELVKS